MGGDQMGRFIVKRILTSIWILFCVMFVIYTLMYLLPSNYIDTMARQLATRPGNTKSASQWLEELNAQYGMDQGLVGGFFTWLGSALRGDFGTSWRWTLPVTEKFRQVIGYSIALGTATFLLQVLIAVPLGILAAKRQYRPTDHAITVTAMVCNALPGFFVASVLKLVFSVKLGWFDMGGIISTRTHAAMSPFMQIVDMGMHLVLPAATIVAVSVGSLMRYTRTNMLEALGADYVRTARAKGLPEHRVVGHHAFRNTLIPLVTILGGSLPGLFAGALITEQLFSIPGIGYTAYQSMIVGDIPFTMFYLSFMAVLTLLGNLIADILYAVVDPRIRLG